MRLLRAIIVLTLWICFAHTVYAQRGLLRRQDASNTPTTSSVQSSTTQKQTASTANATPTSVITSHNTATRTSSPTTSNAKTTTKHVSPTSTGGSNGAKKSNEESLPIQPTITPALGIAGTVLIITGLAFTFVAIQYEWLLVFLGAAYVASLGVTVLILYLMNPPASAAIQGAYLVAALISGLIFGALSLIFKEVTGGLGCLVGGFCISMWFLVLRPGGLITSTTGKAIFISLVSALGWSLSFSKHTRNYGLILCTAFAGATSTIIGIDCFSRAGLKEFWIYIWNLNSQEFPLHTNTYPITRGIRAEIACTIVLFLFGLISQLKVWRRVRQHRTKKELRRSHSQVQRDQRDLQLGLGVEARNARALTEWEAVYAETNVKPFSTKSGSWTPKGSSKATPRVTEREIETIELGDLRASASHPNVTPSMNGGPHSHAVHNSISSMAATAGEESDCESLRSRMLRLGKSLRSEKHRSRLSNEPTSDGETTEAAELPLDQEDDEELIKPLPSTMEPDRDIQRSGHDLIAMDEPVVAAASQASMPETETMRHTSKPVRDLSGAHARSSKTNSLSSLPQLDLQGVRSSGRRRIFSTPVSALQRQRSGASGRQLGRAARSASTPLIHQLLVESPQEDAFASGDTLLNQRSVWIQDRPGTVNFNALIPPSNTDLITPSDSVSARIEAEDGDSDDSNMSLAKRKTLIQQGQIAVASDQASISSRRRSASSGQQSIANQPLSDGPPQPRRSNTSLGQMARLSEWRQTLQQEPSNKPMLMAEQYGPSQSYNQYASPTQYARQSRQNIAEKLRYQDYQQQKNQIERRKRESMAEMAMRTGEMTSKHRSAMRKMQAQANENLKWGKP